MADALHCTRSAWMVPHTSCLVQVIVVFCWGLVGSYVVVGLSASNVWSFVAAFAPLLTCHNVIDTISTAHLTKVR